MSAIEMQPLVHRVNDACARLGISRTTLYQLIKAGELRPIEVGGRVVVAESELRRFVDEKMQQVAA